MQTNILRSFAFVAVGNAALAGRDVSAFERSELFQFSKKVEFLIARGNDEYVPVAPDPLAWFEKLKALGCMGLRLHNMPMQQRPGIGAQSERMLVGMVGGGPRWIIEAVMPSRTEVWEGYDRLGDRDDPDQKIWLSAYIMLGETERQDDADKDVAAATAEVRAALTDIEALALEIPHQSFTESFTGALRVLDGGEPNYPSLEFLNLADLDQTAKRLLTASAEAWVFGAMGSWNDLGVEGRLQQRYNDTSEALFLALQRAVIASANSSYRG